MSKNKKLKVSTNYDQEEIKSDNHQNKIKFIKRTLENNTHEVIEDTKLKNITSWRKSETKFLKNLIFNILSLGILHIISLFYPNLYLKLYCNPWPPKECDFFLVENIYGEFTLCTKIHKKAKNSNNNNFNSEISKEKMISSTFLNYNNNLDNYLTRNLTYSFRYKSVTYEYNEETNEIIPVYMNLSKMTNKGIFNYFADGLSSEYIVKKFQERYGKNEYYINIEIIYLYFLRIELPNIILVSIIGVIELILKDYLSIIVKYIIIILIIFGYYLVGRKIAYGIYKKEYTLDGETSTIKVKRKYKLQNNFYCEIKNNDLLPGDIIYLKPNEYVPCDCLILEGESIVNESHLTGSFNLYKKISLENNNEQFNYKLNRDNILNHGMKIIKTYSKLNEGYISALCINTGPNTFKANLYSNILYLLERKKEYKEMYSFFGENRKSIFIIIIIIFIFSILLGLFYYFTLYVDLIDLGDKRIYTLLYQSILRILCKSFMPSYFLINSIVLILSMHHLTKEHIFSFDKSKILCSNNIDTIFFCKTGTLCENNLEINSYHPVYINPYKSNSISYRTYKKSQCKEMNSQLLKYYKKYLFKSQNNAFSPDFNLRHALRVERNQLNIDKINKESCEFTTLFLECLLSCNNLEKYNIEIFGNYIETSIFKNMGWDIKQYNINYNENNLNDYSSSSINIINNKCFYRNDIYPNNYYKITESTTNELNQPSSPMITRLNSKYYYEQTRKVANNETLEESKSNNFIKNDIIQSHINSYKLRIYKKFMKNNTLNSSAIVYNFITKELRFMTKGTPEDILDKCDLSTLPDNFEKIISFYRKFGLIIMVCASKIINIETYKDSNPIEEYMNDLTFCGFITLKNKLKKEVLNSIKDLRQFNCNLIITTGDDVYNALSVGFDSSIIENKNIFSFDKDDKKNGIIITKLYGIKKLNEEEKDDNNINSSSDKYSKQTTKISNKIYATPLIKPKENIKLKYFDSSIRNSRTKNGNSANDFSLNQENSKNENEYKKISNRKNLRRGSIKKNFKTTKYLINYNVKENQQKRPRLYSDVSDPNNSQMKSTSPNNSNNCSNNNDKNQQNNEVNKRSRLINENKDNLDNSTIKRFKNDIKNKNILFLEKYYLYPGIFEEHEDLSDNCIYCVSGKAFNFLYKNKEKKKCKYILEKFHKYCKIYYNMTSLDKSITIDYYREYPDSCICTIGECPSDVDAIMTSNIGINLKAPKNRNTILSHFYSGNSDILSIKKLIREGRAVKENIILLKLSSIFYSAILNSFIICCFIRQIDVIIGQLNFLEVCFLILSISAFTGETDNNKRSNPLIQKKKLYNAHYIVQFIGMLIIKCITIYLHGKYFIGNQLLDLKYIDYVYCSYFFILCIEQLFSTVFVLNYITFYRKDSMTNIFFIFCNLIILIYFVILTTLSSSNFKMDFLKLTYFEFFDNLIDSYDDHNRLNCLKVCISDFLATLLYSRAIYYIFYKIAD